jgi:hypothetical protein
MKDLIEPTQPDLTDSLPLLAGLSEIPVENSDAKWIQNPNYENSWHLQKDVLILGKSWLHDKMQHRIYGWIKETTHGEHKGKIEASIPALIDEDDENGSDCQILGHFDSVQLAMSAIIENNHPEYGMWI